MFKILTVISVIVGIVDTVDLGKILLYKVE